MIRRTGAVLSLVVLLAGCAGSEEPTEAPLAAPTAPGSSPSPSATEQGTVIELTYAGGQVSGDIGQVEVPLGGTVILRVTSDVAEEVHVHGVDEYVDLPAGQTTEATFVADIPGVFEIELHGAGKPLTKIQVQ
jgi:hypothetical protein